MILLLIFFVYYLGAVATLLLICKNASLKTFLEEGGEKPFKNEKLQKWLMNS